MPKQRLLALRIKEMQAVAVDADLNQVTHLPAAFFAQTQEYFGATDIQLQELIGSDGQHRNNLALK